MNSSLVKSLSKLFVVFLLSLASTFVYATVYTGTINCNVSGSLQISGATGANGSLTFNMTTNDTLVITETNGPCNNSLTTSTPPQNISVSPANTSSATQLTFSGAYASSSYTFNFTDFNAGFVNAGSLTLVTTYVAPTIAAAFVGSNPKTISGTVGTAIANTTVLRISSGTGTAPFTYSYTGNMPAGLSLVPYSTTAPPSNSVYIAGTPTANSTGQIVVSVTDATNTIASTTATINFNITGGDPTPTLTFGTPTAASVAMGGTLTNTATSSISGFGAGAITYSSATTSVATVNSTTGVITPVSVGTSVITATQAAGTGVNASATQTYTVTVSLATPSTFSVSASPTSITPSSTSTLSTSGGSGTGAVTYAVTTGGSSCTLSGNTVTATSTTGTCRITATKAADSTYSASTATVDVTVANLQAQATLVVSASPTAISKNTGTSSLSTTGGSGTGSVSYAVTTGTCTISGSTLTAGSVAETCAVTATKAADSTYLSTTSSVNITVNNRASIADAVNQSVTGTVTAQATVAQRFADAQVNNIASHIQSLRNGFDVKANRVAIGISSPELSQASPVLKKLTEAITNQAMAEAETLKPAYSKDAIEELVQKLNEARNSGNLSQILSLYAGFDHAKVKASLQGLKAGQGESKVLSIRALGANEYIVRIERTWLTGKAIVPVAIQINKDGQYELRYSELELVKSIQASNKDLYGASGKPMKVKATAVTQLAQANIPSTTNQPINQELFGDAPFGIWAAGNLDYGHMNVSAGSNKFGTQGITFGVDFQVQKNLIVGAALGYGYDKTDIDTLGSNVKSDQVSFSAYSIYQPEKDWFVDALLGYGNLNMKNNRYSSAASSIFSADRKGETVYGSFGVGNIFKLNDTKIQPYARAAYTSTTLDAYTEGSNANALGYDKSKLISSSVSAGLLVSEDFAVEGGNITPSAKVEAKRNARGTLNQGIYYADTPSESTVLSMTPAPQNVQSFGLGVVYTEKSSGASLSLNWLGSVGSNAYRANAVKADVRVPF
jgi:Autotransporter beta-domain